MKQALEGDYPELRAIILKVKSIRAVVLLDSRHHSLMAIVQDRKTQRQLLICPFSQPRLCWGDSLDIYRDLWGIWLAPWITPVWGTLCQPSSQQNKLLLARGKTFSFSEGKSTEVCYFTCCLCPRTSHNLD